MNPEFTEEQLKVILYCLDEVFINLEYHEESDRYIGNVVFAIENDEYPELMKVIEKIKGEKS